MSASPECGHVEVWLGIEDINLGEDDGGGEEDKSYHADRQRNVVLNSQTVPSIEVTVAVKPGAKLWDIL